MAEGSIRFKGGSFDEQWHNVPWPPPRDIYMTGERYIRRIVCFPDGSHKYFYEYEPAKPVAPPAGTKSHPCPTCGWPFVKADNGGAKCFCGLWEIDPECPVHGPKYRAEFPAPKPEECIHGVGMDATCDVCDGGPIPHFTESVAPPAGECEHRRNDDIAGQVKCRECGAWWDADKYQWIKPSPSPAIGDVRTKFEAELTHILSGDCQDIADSLDMLRLLFDENTRSLAAEKVAWKDQRKFMLARWKEDRILRLRLAAENERLKAPAIGDVEKLIGDAHVGVWAFGESEAWVGRAISMLRSLAAEATDAKATLAGQSAHVIDLELAVDRLAAEKAKVEEAYDSLETTTNALENMVGDLTGQVNDLRAKLERATKGLKEIKFRSARTNIEREIAHATLKEIGEQEQ